MQYKLCIGLCVLIVLSAAQTVTGRLIGPQGAALANYQFKINNAMVKTDAEGAYNADIADEDHFAYVLNLQGQSVAIMTQSPYLNYQAIAMIKPAKGIVMPQCSFTLKQDQGLVTQARVTLAVVNPIRGQIMAQEMPVEAYDNGQVIFNDIYVAGPAFVSVSCNGQLYIAALTELNPVQLYQQELQLNSFHKKNTVAGIAYTDHNGFTQVIPVDQQTVYLMDNTIPVYGQTVAGVTHYAVSANLFVPAEKLSCTLVKNTATVINQTSFYNIVVLTYQKGRTLFTVYSDLSALSVDPATYAKEGYTLTKVVAYHVPELVMRDLSPAVVKAAQYFAVLYDQPLPRTVYTEEVKTEQ